MDSSDAPFSTIENAHEFLGCLGEAIDQALNEVQKELSECVALQQQRQIDAWRVVFHTTSKLSSHVATSRRLLNDLRTLRNLLHKSAGATA
jgi:hypothetical protein